MTVKDVEAKKLELEATVAAELAEAKKQKPATPEFDTHYALYLGAKAKLAKIDEDMEAARKSEKADAIKTDCTTIAEAITKLLEGLKVADKLGEPVKTLRYLVDDGKADVKINTITKLAGKSERKAGTGRTMIVAADGTSQSPTKFVLAHATEAEKASAAYKYPHTRCDSKPKFDEFCKTHNLTGYTYTPPVAVEAGAES